MIWFMVILKTNPKELLLISNTGSSDKVYNIQNSQDDGYQSQLLSRVYKYFNIFILQLIQLHQINN